MSRALIYHALAELLAGSPAWAADAAREWSLYADLSCLAGESPAARRAVQSLSQIPPESIEQRQMRYAALFYAVPGLWLHESAAKTGKMLGPEMFAVAKLYRAAGLVASFGAEPPDHASVELAFLAHLSEQAESNPDEAADWRALERQFIKDHAGWLIQLGRTLSNSGDTVYGPIGRVLAYWLTEAAGPAHRDLRPEARNTSRPTLARAEDCTLCGFCVQVCPVHALAVRESEGLTMLLLNARACIGCNRCKRICGTGAITLQSGTQLSAGAVVLRQSPRAICPSCHQPTISRAELEYIASQIGAPAWLDYCLECRPSLYGG